MAAREVLFNKMQASRMMGLTPTKLDALIEEGKVEAVRDGIDTLIPRHAILDYLAEVSAVPLKQREGRAK